MNEQTPALNHLLSCDLITPADCEGCPFAKLEDDQLVNYADMAEAYYHCALLGIRVWGESPKCDLKDWQARAKQELNDRQSP